jgi:predicted transcriptional regulator
MADTQMPAVSPAEAEILRIVCHLRYATVQQVVDALPAHRDIGYATVQTLLRRLEKKGYVVHAVDGKAHVFRAKVQHDQALTRSVHEFVDQLFGGDPVSLMMHLAGSSKLKKKDVDRLRRLLDDPDSKSS